jgi:1,4-alpha-glucan branching enzyme
MLKPNEWSGVTTATREEIESLFNGEHSDPFHVLGAHRVDWEGQPAVAIRVYLPGAEQVWVARDSGLLPAQRVHGGGFFEALFPGVAETFPYRLRARFGEGNELEFEDPYRFPPVLTEFDLYLLGEGTHHKSYEKLGAHVMELEGVRGVLFAVWAPNAQRVSVVGNFNNWDGRRNPLRSRGSSGVWELFVPGLEPGEVYKYEVKGPNDYLGLKADPYAFQSELRPRTASVACELEGYEWGDGEWMEGRTRRQSLESPVSIYEVHLGSWRRGEGNRLLGYRELAEQLVAYVIEMGFTHIELMPVMEHPLDESWGYQTTGFFAPTRRHGTPHDFMYFVDYCHQHGVGVILDWVPAHFPSDGHGLAYFDGTHLYEHEDPRLREHPDWGTRIFNYGRAEVRNFLWSSALFWLDKYHADGLRVDAVASMLYLDYSRKSGEWIPNRYGGNENLEAIDFIKRFNELAHQESPGALTIAEESTAWPGVSRPTHLGGLGFSLKWNMGWMHDTLLYFSKDPIHRKYHHHLLTFALLYAFSENFVLVFSHDEVVHGKRALLAKMPGDTWRQFANLRSLYAFQYTHPGKKMLFMGGELGQWNEWNSQQALDWNLLDFEPHRQIKQLLTDLNRMYRAEASLHQVDFEWQGFEWIDFHDADSSVVAFLRRAHDPRDHLLIACNFTPVTRTGYRIGAPEACFYREIFNSDEARYGGNGVSNAPGRQALQLPWQNQPCHLEVDLPPLGVVVFKPSR